LKDGTGIFTIERCDQPLRRVRENVAEPQNKSEPMEFQPSRRRFAADGGGGRRAAYANFRRAPRTASATVAARRRRVGTAELSRTQVFFQ
jgi:hypothetical protein